MVDIPRLLNWPPVAHGFETLDAARPAWCDCRPTASGRAKGVVIGLERSFHRRRLHGSPDGRRADTGLTPQTGKPNDDKPPAGWRRGYAADCKSVKTGSIPVPASIPHFSLDFLKSSPEVTIDFIEK